MEEYNLLNIKVAICNTSILLNFRDYRSSLFFYRTLVDYLKGDKSISKNIEYVFRYPHSEFNFYKRITQKKLDDKALIKLINKNSFYSLNYQVKITKYEEKDFRIILKTVIDLANKFNFLGFRNEPDNPITHIIVRHYLIRYYLKGNDIYEEKIREIKEGN